MRISDCVKISVDNTEKKAACQKCCYKERIFVKSFIANSNVLIVGEAPGQVESQEGCPFKGQSGQLLRKLLREAGFEDEKLSYVNTVSCHPPGNETPKKDAMEICAKLFLHPIIASIKPKLAILAGSVALNAFFPGERIMEKKGSFQSKNGITFLPVLHPAYCLRNPASTMLLKKDLEKAKAFLDGSLNSKKEYTILKTVADFDACLEEILLSDIISVDIETSGTLDPLKEDAKIWTIAFGYAQKKAVCIPLEHPEVENIEFKDKARKVVEKILKSHTPKIFHNCSFDLKFLKKFGFKVNGKINDTMVMSYLLDENKHSYSLKILAAEFLDGYDTEFSKNLNELGVYNCSDADNTLRLYNLFIVELQKHKKLLKLYEEVLVPMCKVISDMELTGILIDVPYLDKLTKIYRNKTDSIMETIHKEFPESVQVDLSSPKQLGVLLFNTLKYQSKKQTKTGQRSVDSEVLEKLSEEGNTFAKYLLRLRNYEKLLSTYIKNIPEMVKSDGRIHCGFHITGTRTGRLSSSNPNMQNIPRSKDIKKMFIAKPGFKIINVDASQAELRVGCSIANERNMIKAYNEGADIHKLTASKVLNKEISKITQDDRQKAKGVNFGFLYGSSAEGFKGYAESTYGLKLSLNECIQFRKRYFESYPDLLSWYRRVEDSIRKNGFVEYPDGRFARFPNTIGLYEIPSEIIRKGINYPVQGGSSDIILFTMVKLQELLKKDDVQAEIIVTVHDSIVLECAEAQVQAAIDVIKIIAKEEILKQFPWLKVPMLFDFAAGPNWGELEVIK